MAEGQPVGTVGHGVRTWAVWGWALMGLLSLCISLGLGGCAGAGSQDVRTASDETETDKRARVRMELAMAYFSRGQLPTALDEVKQALVTKPDYPDALSLRGLIYGAMKEPALAEESFKRALSLNRRNPETLHNYGWFLCQQKRYADADVQFRQALTVPSYRELARTLLAQGVCQARNRQWVEAEKTLSKAFEQDPANPAVSVNLSEVLYRRGDYERARFYVRRVNASEEQVSAQSLWLAIRIERRLKQTMFVRVLGRQLSTQFAKSPEAQLYEKGQFDDE